MAGYIDKHDQARGAERILMSDCIPAIIDWPYTQISGSIAEFQAAFAQEPRIIWIGIDLWMQLRQAAPDAESFNFCEIPIRLDRSGILEGTEFMVSL